MRTKVFFEVLLFKTSANLRSEISRYYLNFLWWVVEPLLMLGLFYIIFGIFLNKKTDDYVAFLLCGLTAWNWFNRTVSNSAGSICGNYGLMMQLNINKIFFPLEVFLQDFFKHFFVFGLLLIFLIFYPTPVETTWLAIPAVLAVQGMLVLGVSVLVAAIVPFFPDLKFIVNTGLTIMFFASGVFFSIDDVVLPEHRYIMFLNPMAGLIEVYRNVLIHNTWPDWLYLLKIFLVSSLVFVIGAIIIARFDHRYPRLCQ